MQPMSSDRAPSWWTAQHPSRPTAHDGQAPDRSAPRAVDPDLRQAIGQLRRTLDRLPE